MPARQDKEPAGLRIRSERESSNGKKMEKNGVACRRACRFGADGLPPERSP